MSDLIRDFTWADGVNLVVNATDITSIYRITGGGVMTVSWGVTYNGTPYNGETRIIRWYCNSMVLGGNVVSVFGTQIPDDLANKDWVATAIYSSLAAKWEITAVPDWEETEIVSTAQLKDLAVTTVKINDLAVTTGKINDLAVTDAKLNANSVITTKVLDSNITYAKIQDMAANTVLSNATAGAAAPSELAMGASTILARLAAGNIVAATPAQIVTLLSALTTVLPSAQLFVGSAANVATARTMTGDGALSDTGVLTISNSVIEPLNTGQVAEGVTNTGILCCKYIDGADLKALLDGTNNDMFAMKANDVILSLIFVTQTPHGAPATVDIGADASIRTAGADTNGFMELGNAGAAGKYLTDNATYSGALLDFGRFTCDADGYVTVISSIDISAGAFVGFCSIYYLSA